MPRADARSTRGRPTVLLAAAGALMVARLAAGVAEARHPPPPGGLVDWQSPETPPPAAGDKPILYDFSAAWCGPCKRMEREVFADAKAAAFINRTYVAVRVADENQDMVAHALRSRYRIDALPTLVVVMPSSEEHPRMEGYPGRRRVMSFLEGAAHPRPEPAAPRPPD